MCLKAEEKIDRKKRPQKKTSKKGQKWQEKI